MRVDIYNVDQDTGAETLEARGVRFSDVFPDADGDDDAAAAYEKLRLTGESMVGGGAAPLVRLTRTQYPDVITPIDFQSATLASGEHIAAHITCDRFKDGRVEFTVDIRHDDGLSTWHYQTESAARDVVRMVIAGEPFTRTQSAATEAR